MNDRNDPGTPDEGRPFGTAADLDFDLSLVHADDEYLDMLGGANLEDPDGVPDDQLSALLMSWRRDVEAEPIDDVVDTQLATVTVHAAQARRRRRPRLLVPFAAAAAVLAIAFAGFGLAARDAQPGDTLWALTKVLYADHARSVEAAQAVRADLREAENALIDGRVDDAKSKLEDAHAALPTVASEDGQKDLEKKHASLVAQLPGTPSGEAPQPPVPNPSTAATEPGTDPGTGGGTDPGSDETAPATEPGDTSGEQTQPEDTTTPSSPSDTPSSENEPSRSESQNGQSEQANSLNGEPRMATEDTGAEAPAVAPE